MRYKTIHFYYPVSQVPIHSHSDLLERVRKFYVTEIPRIINEPPPRDQIYVSPVSRRLYRPIEDIDNTFRLYTQARENEDTFIIVLPESHPYFNFDIHSTFSYGRISRSDRNTTHHDYNREVTEAAYGILTQALPEALLNLRQ